MPFRRPLRPPRLLPWKNSPHRVAAIALYRALLLQCRAAPVGAEQRFQLQNIVQNRFRQQKNLQGSKRLQLAFQAGYEGIDVLDAAVAGDEEKVNYIVELLQRAPDGIKQALHRKKSCVAVERENSRKTDKTVTDKKPSDTIFARPLPLSQLSGARHVPRLYNANTVAVLRIKKPQPESLSGYINHRNKRDQRRRDLDVALVDLLNVAAGEQQWDAIMHAQHGISEHTEEPRESSEPDWTEAIEQEIMVVRARILEKRVQDLLMAEKMQNVVDREQAIFDQEKEDRKALRRSERLARQEHRRSLGPAVAKQDEPPEVKFDRSNIS